MSGVNFKEVVLIASDAVSYGVNWTPFNLLLLAGSFTHMVIIALNDCHSDKGETSFFCGKAWINCKIAQNMTYVSIGNSSTLCPIRTCFEPNCVPQMINFDDRPAFADVLQMANFVMRWVYTGVTALRIFGMGLILKEGAFFRSPWCVLDILVVVSAWLNRPFVFGNMMFFMVLRGFKLLLDSTHPMLSTPRVQMKALGMGLFKIFLVFVLLNFIMGFFSLLAMSLIGSKGDFHNRCAVPVYKNGTFTYEPLVPEVVCRMDHLYDLNTDGCFGDVWDYEPPSSDPKAGFVPTSTDKNKRPRAGCQGTCAGVRYFSNTSLGREINLNAVGIDNQGNPAIGNQVYCIGPDFVPLDKTGMKLPPKSAGGGDIKDYTPANTTHWPSYGNNDIRNFDSIGTAAIVMYTIFYRASWTETIKPVTDIGGKPVIIGWIAVMIFTSYYLLNITVSITCSHYSEATEEEAAMLEAAKDADKIGVDDVDDEEDLDSAGSDDDDEQALGGMQVPRERLLEDADGLNYPWCGRGCDCFTIAGNAINNGANMVGKILMNRYPIMRRLCRPICLGTQSALGGAFRLGCRAFIRCSIAVNFGSRKVDPDAPPDAPIHVGRSLISRLSVMAMIGCMLTQGLQNSQINLFKCSCTDAQLKQLENLGSLPPCDAGGLCIDPATNKSFTNATCYAGHCVTVSRQGFVCYNPRENMLLTNISRVSSVEIPQPGAVAWMAERATWCAFGRYIHYALYGWAFIFLLELAVRYFGHQGFANYFTMELYSDEPGANRRPNVRNIVDSVCILLTVGGIVVTEYDDSPPDQQVLMSFVSYIDPRGGFLNGEWGVPWIFKTLRLATLIRLGIRVPALTQIAVVAVILRGFRGVLKVLLGIVFLMLMIFFFALLGKEMFDYGYSWMITPFVSISDFHDVASSMLPLLEIMVGSGWYEYAKAGTSSLGLGGFVYFCLFYFVVNFQFLRIFIAIITQNYELTEEEKKEAQKRILFSQFEKAEVEVDKERKARFTDFDKFSFNRHYHELLKGAQISLRKLEQYQRQLAEGGDDELLGFNEENEAYLAGEDSDDEDQKGGQDEDEGDKVLEQIEMIKKRLTINPQDLYRKKAVIDDEVKIPLSTRVRAALRRLLKNDIFNFIVMLLIIASTVFSVYNTIDQDTGIEGLENNLALVFLGFFVAEAALKMVAYGLFGPSPTNPVTGYFRRGWCILDFIIVILQIADVVITLFPDLFKLGDSADILKGFRALRVARLLARLQNLGPDGKNPLKVILQALGASLPSIFVLLCSVFFLCYVFSIAGMDQYMGLMGRCTSEDPLSLTGQQCTLDSDCFPGYFKQCPWTPESGSTFGFCRMDKVHCHGTRVRTPTVYERMSWRSIDLREFEFAIPRIWKVTEIGFDNIWSAMYTMVSMINRSFIREQMVQLLSTTERDMAPKEGANGTAGIYVIFMIIVLGIFISQIVIGLIMTNLRLKSGLAFHMKEQLVWPATKDAFDFLPSPFVSKALTEADLEGHPFKVALMRIQMKFQYIRDNWKFELLMTATVGFNVVLLSTLYFDMPGDRQEIFWWGGFVCFLLYCLEFLVKTIADAKSYFMSPADQVDIVLTLLTGLDLFVFPNLGVDLGLSSLRMFRLFRIFTRSTTFVRLLETISTSFPQAVAAVVLLAMTLFIFAVIFTRIFGNVKEQVELDTTFNNFATAINSMIALFRVSSGAAWGKVIKEAAIEAPFCTPKYWTPLKLESTAQVFASDVEGLRPFGAWNNMDLYPDPVSDCGQQTLSYVFFVIYVFINNYIILPTFVASIIASYFEANLKEHSLVSYKSLVTFRDCWKEAGDEIAQAGAGKFVSVMHFDRNKDPATKDKQPFLFDRFDTLLSLLELNSCPLGFNKHAAPDKYKAAITRLKARANDHEKVLKISYKAMAVMLLSITEKARPVTIVDILRRDKAIKVLQSEGGKPLPMRKKQKEGKAHAAINLPSSLGIKEKKMGLKDRDIVYSYNIYVVLDQLARLDSQRDRIPPLVHAGLKKMVDDNDEDLFIYFEEYLEKSGPVYQESGDAWRALLRFSKKAQDVYSRSSYANEGKSDEPKEEEGPEDADEDEGVATDTESEEEEEEADAEREEEEGEENGDEIRPAAPSKPAFGEVIEDEEGTLDLRNWTQCVVCGEPVEKSWERCPNCNKAWPAQALPEGGQE